jgi:citrate synthase
MKSIIDGFHETPNGCISALTSAIKHAQPKSVNADNEKKCIKPFARLWGKFLVIAIWTYRKSMVILKLL